MDLKQAFTAEITQSIDATHKMLANVPTDKNDFKPHEKSMALGRLASHVAELLGWITMTLENDEMDMATREYKPFIASSNEELIALFDEKAKGALTAIEHANVEDFSKIWTFRNGEKVYFSMPKAAVIRSFALNHFYHHRGQLSVYLRLLDVHVPGMYGPSKDDQLMMEAHTAAAN